MAAREARALPEKQFMNETRRPGRGWRILRRVLISLAVLATLIAAFYTEEDWRGKHDWETYKHEWEAKGEKFDWQAFVPPSVPNDQNFFTAPVFTNMITDKITMTPYGNDGGPDFHRIASQTGYAVFRMQITDLQAWQDYYRHRTNTDAKSRFPVAQQPQTPAKDVLLALSKFDSAVEELRQASQRSYANVPLNYEDGFNTVSSLLPVLAELKRCTQLLQLRASAELADGQSAAALGDVKLLFRLNNSHPQFAVFDFTPRPDCDHQSDNPANLGRFGGTPLVGRTTCCSWTRNWLNWIFWRITNLSMRGERAFAIASFESQRRTHEIDLDATETRVTSPINFTFMPSAYFYPKTNWLLPG